MDRNMVFVASLSMWPKRDKNIWFVDNYGILYGLSNGISVPIPVRVVLELI